MKILSIIVLIAVSVVSFSPCLWAGDSAGLNLTVTFAVDKPPVWVIEPMDKSVKAGETLTIEVLASDPDNTVVNYGCRWWLNGVRQAPLTLPAGATFVWKSVTGQNPKLTWIVPTAVKLTDIHEFEFFAGDSQLDPSLGNTISKKIKATLLDGRIISVEINNPTWNLTDVKLNEKKNNNDPLGVPMHAIKNVGNVPVTVEIGYMPTTAGLLHPGLLQGLDTYITMVGTTVLPPAEKLRLSYTILPGVSSSLPLIFGSPTAISMPTTSLSVGYEVRAYAADVTI